MAVVLELNIGGAIVKFRDDNLRSREESEIILQRTADRILQELNNQYNAKRSLEAMKEGAKAAD